MARLALGKVLKKKKMSKRQFAKLLAEDYHNVFRYFRPGYDPKLSKLTLWAKLLNVKVRDLIEE